MYKISLYDTASRAKKTIHDEGDFLRSTPLNIYVCGPTVYDTPHIGNARPAIVFGTLVKFMRHLGISVNYVSNYTDVDDKIIQRAEERGVSIEELCETTIANYRNALQGIGVTMPDKSPRATEYIPEMVAFIQKLIDLGHAYEAEGHVLFDTTTSTGTFLVHGRTNEQSRIDPVSYKRNQADFVLWKPEWKGVGWDSPWGKGRPGWHIECSTMIDSVFGDEPLHIHGGGNDLIFPHHEAECHQSYCGNRSALAELWMHSGMVMIDGKKMSKSDGNFVTIDEVLERGLGDALRFSMLNTHYRQPYDFSWERLENDHRTLMRWQYRRMVNGITGFSTPDTMVTWAVRGALKNDFNLSEYFASIVTHNEYLDLGLDVLGFPRNVPELPDSIARLMEARAKARMEKDYARSDKLRAEIESHGIELMDGPISSEWRWVK